MLRPPVRRQILLLPVTALLATVTATLVGSSRRRPLPSRRSAGARLTGDAGQTTAEYALVLLGAAAIAALMIAWASQSGAIGDLFDAVLSHVIGSVT